MVLCPQTQYQLTVDAYGWSLTNAGGWNGDNRRKLAHDEFENVVDDALTFKLGDLGTARRIDDMFNTFAGTPIYMAPEVCCRTPY